VHTAAAGNGYILHVHTAGVGKGYTLQFNTAGGENHLHVQTAELHVHRRLLLVLFLIYDAEKPEVNEGIPGKFSPASVLLPVVKCLSPASGFVRYPWSRISPALPSYANLVSIG
jgi:hypothetical protein